MSDFVPIKPASRSIIQREILIVEGKKPASPSFSSEHFRMAQKALKQENELLKGKYSTVSSQNHAIAKKLSTTEAALYEAKSTIKLLRKQIALGEHKQAAAAAATALFLKQRSKQVNKNSAENLELDAIDDSVSFVSDEKEPRSEVRVRNGTTPLAAQTPPRSMKRSQLNKLLVTPESICSSNLQPSCLNFIESFCETTSCDVEGDESKLASLFSFTTPEKADQILVYDDNFDNFRNNQAADNSDFEQEVVIPAVDTPINTKHSYGKKESNNSKRMVVIEGAPNKENAVCMQKQEILEECESNIIQSVQLTSNIPNVQGQSLDNLIEYVTSKPDENVATSRARRRSSLGKNYKVYIFVQF
jgi:hypothetical protein